MVTTELLETALWGRLPFDLYLLENWNFNSSEDQTAQWERLAFSYFKLGTQGRHPYNSAIVHASRMSFSPWTFICPGDPFKALIPSQAQIENILRPSQTVQERNISAHFHGRRPQVLLRTYYGRGSDARFSFLMGLPNQGQDELLGAMNYDAILDDASRYDFGDSWEMIYEFLPGLVDGWINMEDEQVRADLEVVRADLCQSDEEGGKEVYRKSFQVKCFLFVMDEEAMQTGWVRLIWLGETGESVWENRVLVGEISTITAMWGQGYLMHEIIMEEDGYYEGYTGEPEPWESDDEAKDEDVDEDRNIEGGCNFESIPRRGSLSGYQNSLEFIYNTEE